MFKFRHLLPGTLPPGSESRHTELLRGDIHRYCPVCVGLCPLSIRLKCRKEIELTGIPVPRTPTDPPVNDPREGGNKGDGEKERERQEEGGYPARKGCDI